MSERYLRMFSLPQNQYAAGSPVIVRAGVLLQDTMTDRLVGQIKFENISNRVISSMEVRLALLGANGNRLGECAEHRYLDAAAQPYAVFGAKEAISIEEPFAKGFCIDVIQVIFDDGTLWRSKEAEPFVSMPEPYKLEDALMSEELADEYRLNTTPQAIYAPSSYKDVWVCACGAYNKETEEVCHACGQTVETLSENLDPEELRSKRERRQMTWAPKARKHRKRPKLWVIVIALVVCVAALAGGAKLWMNYREEKAAEEARKAREISISNAKRAGEELMLEAEKSAFWEVDFSYSQIQQIMDTFKVTYTAEYVNGDILTLRGNATFSLSFVDARIPFTLVWDLEEQKFISADVQDVQFD